MTKPITRYGVDWDDDLFICYDARSTDALNRLHTGLSSDAGLVNLHWNYVNKSVTGSATSIVFVQEVTDYGIRIARCVTGTPNVSAGFFFGRTGSVNDFAVSNATVYTAVVWVRASVGSGTPFLFTMENSTGSTGFTVTANWQKVTLVFTTTNVTTAFKIIKNASATNVTLDVTGFMIVDGSTAPNGFNVGDASNLYDNITADVKSCRSEIGKPDYTKNMISEGKATLLLDNDSRRYSPEYASSPLFGKMDSQRRFTADVQNSSGTYVRRFTGWAIKFLPTYGTKRSREMTMSCQQGKSHLDRIKYTQLQTGATTADAVIKAIVLKGYASAATPLQIIMNRARLGACYFVNPDDIYDIQEGLSSLDAEGAEDWVDAPATQVIDSVVTVDQGFFFIDHDGKVVYYNREKYLNPAYGVTPTAINLDSEVQGAQYVYGANYANTIKLNYYPNTTRVDTVWNSQGPIRVYAGGLRVKVIDVKFEYLEGKRMKVVAVNGFNGGVDDSTCVATVGTVDVSDKVKASFELSGSGGKLTIFNTTNQAIYIVVTLKGTIVESYGGQEVTVTDAAGLLGGTVQINKSSKLVSDETQATNLANYLLAMSKQNVGQFSSIQMLNKNNTQLDKMLALEIGSMVRLSETQTAHSNKDYYICGVNEEWRADNVLNTTYNLSPIFRQPPIWILGTSVLGQNTYLAY